MFAYVCVDVCVYTGVFVHVQVGICLWCVCRYVYVCLYVCRCVCVCRYAYICVCVGSRTVLVADPDCPLISCFHSTYPPCSSSWSEQTAPYGQCLGLGLHRFQRQGFHFEKFCIDFISWTFLIQNFEIENAAKSQTFWALQGPRMFWPSECLRFQTFFWYWSSGHVSLGTWFVFTVPLCKGSSSSSSVWILDKFQTPDPSIFPQFLPMEGPFLSHCPAPGLLSTFHLQTRELSSAFTWKHFLCTWLSSLSDSHLLNITK